ncbi:TetR/AcrR family transcriptional regulator [Dyella sp. LX-66]|jgi:AcrR family transcriptional regulator|uniref:TetR/AcrR family transcriptional regulator n=1 Tax=Dyella TaxID=231454 RepID=UPI0014463636|nr:MULTISPECIES: TetR/AcrR family transcriptional regulator [unclassified Dyella]MBT2117886.1 TetR/AcrR family transcriptional regulator [Dyella sp. LX-1]MBT2142219.1 TetR/AcrR family transcriptional regulator [Dyella sp. LX-66]NKJ19815.1 AcrR family transcriptional regulator [Dyella sp. SG609]
MPYTAEHKQKTRERIVESARELFNRRGFSDVSIDEIMRQAGLTRGGFYNHFKAKEELYAETVAAYMHFDPSQRWSGIEFDPDAKGTACAQQMVNIYLSTAHLEDVEGHCPLVALPADAARAGPQARMAYCKLVEHMAGMLSGGLEGCEGEEARKRGLAITALCVGGMVLARTIDDPAFVEEVRLAAREMALKLIGPEAA